MDAEEGLTVRLNWGKDRRQKTSRPVPSFHQVTFLSRGFPVAPRAFTEAMLERPDETRNMLVAHGVSDFLDAPAMVCEKGCRSLQSLFA